MPSVEECEETSEWETQWTPGGEIRGLNCVLQSIMKQYILCAGTSLVNDDMLAPDWPLRTSCACT